MKKYSIIFAVLIGFSLVLFSQNKEPEKIELSLMDCVLSVLKDNLEIAVQSYEPEIAEFSIKQAQDIYWPKLNLGYSNFCLLYTSPSPRD